MREHTLTEALVALLLGLILVTVGGALSEDVPEAGDTRASSYVTDLDGTRGLYEILREIGARPERHVRAPKALDETNRTVFVGAPSEPFLQQDVDALFDWVARGGRLVVAAAAPRPPRGTVFHRVLLHRVGLRARQRMVLAESAAVEPGSGLDPLLRLDWPARLVIEFAPRSVKRDERTGELKRLVGTRANLLAATLPFGDAGGEVVVISDVSLLTNEVLRSEENAVLAVNLLLAREQDEGRVIFDEFHHGFRPGGERAGLMGQAAAMLLTTWPGRAVLVLVLAWTVVLFGRTPRLGRALPEPPPSRRELSEHADALGRLLESARSRKAALAMLAAGTRRAVGARTGLPAAMAPREFRRRLAASPADGARELADALEVAETLEPGRDADLARAARDLATARRRYVRGSGSGSGSGRRHGKK